MSVAIAAGPEADRRPQHWGVSPVLFCFLAASVATALTVGADPAYVWRSIGNSDDALRLYQVKLLLDGHGWYNMSLPQMGLPEPLTSHWSRLVDLPMAAIIAAGRAVMSDTHADLVLRIVWPLAMLTLMMALAARETALKSGRLAGAVTLALAATCVFATFQFMPGRIDHHGVQIVGACGGLLALLRALRTGSGGVLAGALFAIGLAVGYEALVLVFACLFVAGVLAACDARMLAPLARCLQTLTAGLALAWAVTVPPSNWLAVSCDALAVNLVVLVFAGAAIVTVAARHALAWTPAGRLAFMGAGGVVGLIAFGAVEPACLAGPAGQVDFRIVPIWASKVTEARSLFQYFDEQPALVCGFVVMCALGLGLALRTWWSERTGHAAFAAATVVLATLYGAAFIKFMPYVAWLVIPVIATWIARLDAIGEMPARTIRLGAFVAVNSITVLSVAGLVLSLLTAKPNPTRAAAGNLPANDTCLTRFDYESFAKLPPGNVFNAIDLGPQIVAQTPHRVLVGPYHRIPQSILLWHEIRLMRPEAARARLLRLGIEYVALCGFAKREGHAPSIKRVDLSALSFAQFLRAGGSLPWLQRVDLGATRDPLMVWRVRPRATR